MTLVSRDGKELVFALHDWERSSLAAVLTQYPQIPPGGFEMTKHGLGKQAGHDGALHEELLAEHQQASRARVRRFLREKLAGPDATDPSHVIPLKLDTDAVTWLLQVLNDIRVGGWIKLGRPDEAALRRLARSKDASAAIGLMEFCAYVQSALLDAVME